MNRWTRLVFLTWLLSSITLSVFSQTCDVLKGQNGSLEQPQWKQIYEPLISSCSGGSSNVDTSFVRSYPSPLSAFVYLDVYKNSLAKCQIISESERKYWQGIYKSLKDNTYDGAKFFDGGSDAGSKFSAQCRSAILVNLEKVFGTGGSSSASGSTSNNMTTNANNQLRPEQPQQSTQQNQATQQQAQQARAAQQQSQQAVFNSAQNQTAADQTRKSERRRHEPENEASHCIQPDFGGLYGGMKNTCDFKVWCTYCGYRPKENSWLTGMSCEKQSFGSDSVSPGRTSASHTKGVESIHWIACKEPAWALDAEFVPGQGIKGRCYTIGGK